LTSLISLSISLVALIIPPLENFALAFRVMKTFALSAPTGAAAGTFIVLQAEFWLNGLYAGISEVAYAVQDLSVNRVGIFPTEKMPGGDG
jgi:hypothetical protein